MSREPMSAPGPFRADQIRDGDPYELKDGHAIHCMTAGGRHGGAQGTGAVVFGTDPAVGDKFGVDVGIAWNKGKNLRAPDIVVGALEREPGWQHVFPPLAVEYADTGQDEEELEEKIKELLTGGTKLVWVVRLVGPLRVEVHAKGMPKRTVGGEEELTAPGILQNPVPVRALVEQGAANAAALRNLLSKFGYQSVDEIETKMHAEGHAEGRAEALLDVLAARKLVLSDADVLRIRRCQDSATLRRWMTRAAVATSVVGLLDD